MATNSDPAESGIKATVQGVVAWGRRNILVLLRLLISAIIIVAAVGIHDEFYGTPRSALAVIAIIIIVTVVNVFYQPLKRLISRRVS